MKKTVSILTSFCVLAAVLCGCNSNETSDLDKIIGELSTSYLEGQGPAAVSTEATTPAPFTNAVCGVISGSFGGTFMITDETGTTYNVNAASSVIYGADEIADGMTAVVSFIDTSSKSKSINAVSVTIISGQADTSTEETLSASDETSEQPSDTSESEETDESADTTEETSEIIDETTSSTNS